MPGSSWPRPTISSTAAIHRTYTMEGSWEMGNRCIEGAIRTSHSQAHHLPTERVYGEAVATVRWPPPTIR